VWILIATIIHIPTRVNASFGAPTAPQEFFIQKGVHPSEAMVCRGLPRLARISCRMPRSRTPAAAQSCNSGVPLTPAGVPAREAAFFSINFDSHILTSGTIVLVGWSASKIHLLPNADAEHFPTPDHRQGHPSCGGLSGAMSRNERHAPGWRNISCTSYRCRKGTDRFFLPSCCHPIEDAMIAEALSYLPAERITLSGRSPR